MGIFFEKPTKGPDVVGGVWPIKDKGYFWNRTGQTLEKGDVVQVAITPGEATEIATNDANSYIPGASNDTIWNSVIDPRSNTSLVAGAAGSAVNTGGIWAVVLDNSVADNARVECQLFGVCDAYVVRSNTTSTNPGSPLTVYGSNGTAKINSFDPVILSNEVVVATLLGYSNAALTTRRLRKVLLHQGLFWQRFGGTAFTAT